MPIKNIHKKHIGVLTVMLASLVTLSPFAIDTYLAAMPLMAEFFGVKIGLVELTITLYFFGFAVGNFFGGPLSDSFGRRTIALVGVALYALSALGVALSNSIEMILIFRVVQAFGGGFATVTANVFIRDWYDGKHVARMITIVSMMMMIAPLIAPVVGTFLIGWNGWQAVFYFLFAFGTVLFVLFFVLIPESRDKASITKRISREQLFAKYRTFFSDKQSVILLFSISFSMAGMYVFLTAASFIYLDFFDVSQNQFPLFFGANVVLNILLSFLNTQLLKRYQPRDILRIGMLIQLLAGVILLVAVFQETTTLWFVFSGIVLFIGSLGLVFGNGSAVILNINPKVSGSANATIGITRFLLSFIIGSIMALFHSHSLLPIGLSMFSCTLLGNILLMVGASKRFR